ncbi:MAG: thioredoxin family protein [Armatimonadota bacterium]|nr:thioredoxin family protein [Armatimonadota bacterium]MDR7401735.1 thioredoxin family protein [Armatimonadota bacterium]MDR7404127.1 thioredoxin family protein [Armatimonadota bacterium]MDR7436262.1 thioredoxin family protein [Armatimonadota bacterium]MDR7471358.1 thioredoxin family protein [Armatimonadota bacterium]
MVADRLAVLGVVAAVVAVVWLGLRWRAARYRRRPATDLVRGRPLVLAFSTPDCVPCRTLQKPALLELQRRYPGQVDVREVDAAADPALAGRFGILTVPSTVLISGDGVVRAINQGAVGWERLAAQLELNGKGPRARMAARTAR